MIWYDCDDMLPADEEIVLVADKISGFVSLGRYNDEKDEFCIMGLDPIEIDAVITHWADLPEFKEEDDDS